MKKLLLLLLVFPLFAFAQDQKPLDIPGRYDFSTADTYRQAAFTGLLLLDYAQTRSIRGFCDGRINCTIHETNPILGTHPSDTRIATYFIGVGVGHYLVAKALPSEYRPYWQSAGILLEALVVIHNRKLGLTFKF